MSLQIESERIDSDRPLPFSDIEFAPISMQDAISTQRYSQSASFMTPAQVIDARSSTSEQFLFANMGRMVMQFATSDSSHQPLASVNPHSEK